VDEKWASISSGEGYHRIAMGFLKAMVLGRFGDYELLLLEVMIDRSWTQHYLANRGRGGDLSPDPVKLCLREIAQYHDVNETRLYEASASLVSRGVLSREGKTYLINKVFPEWKAPKGGPLFTPRQLEIIREAGRLWAPKNLHETGDKSPPRRRFSEDEGGENLRQSGDKYPPERRFSDSSQNENLRQNGDKSPPNRRRNIRQTGDSVSPPLTPIEERARKKELEEREDNPPPGETRARERVAIVDDEAKIDPAKRLWDLAETLCPNEYLSGKVSGWLAGYPPDWVEAAIYSAWVNTKENKRAPYVNKCLIAFRERGGPAPEDVRRVQDGQERRTIPIQQARPPKPMTELEAKRARMKLASAKRGEELRRQREEAANVRSS